MKHQSSLWLHVQDFSNHAVKLRPLQAQRATPTSQHPINNRRIEPHPRPTTFSPDNPLQPDVHHIMEENICHYDLISLSSFCSEK